MNKRGGFTDLFLFIIVAFIIVLFLAVFIYISNTTKDEIRANFQTTDVFDNQNATAVLDDTLGSGVASFNAFYWLASLLIFGMIIAIFIGSYLVTTKPIFFIPYIFIVIIAVIVAVPISNAYETLYTNATLGSTFANFVGGTWVLLKLPIIVSIVGIVGGIIMFTRIGKKEEAYYGY